MNLWANRYRTAIASIAAVLAFIAAARSDISDPSPTAAAEQGRKQFDKHMEAEGRSLAQLMSKWLRSYELTVAGEAATKAVIHDPDFIKELEQRGINWKDPTPAEAASIKEGIGVYVRHKADVKPEIVAWLNLLESHGSPWPVAIRYHRELSLWRPQDILPSLVMMTSHPKQSERDAQEWLDLLKESFFLTTDADMKAAALMIAAVELPDLSRTNVTGAILTKLADWVRSLDKNNAAPMISNKIGQLQMAVAIARGDFAEAADHAMDSPLRAWAPIWYTMKQKWKSAEQAISKLKRAPDLSEDERKTLAMGEQLFAALSKRAAPAEQQEDESLKQKIEKLQDASAKGDGESTYALGKMYAEANGVPRDYAKAMEWFRKADQQGFAKAPRAIGTLYMMGAGVKPDQAEAARWYRKAAEAGDPVAAANVSHMYRTGMGVEQDPFEEFRWALKGAHAGAFPCQARVGEMYMSGRGVTPNHREALKWLTKAVAQDPEGDTNMLASVHYMLGRLYMDGEGIPTQPDKAVYWLKSAAALGHGEAPYHLGLMFRDGNGVERSPIDAFKWFCLAAARGERTGRPQAATVAEAMTVEHLTTAVTRAYAEYSNEVAAVLEDSGVPDAIANAVKRAKQKK